MSKAVGLDGPGPGPGRSLFLGPGPGSRLRNVKIIQKSHDMNVKVMGFRTSIRFS